jgi:hypothetical protein
VVFSGHFTDEERGQLKAANGFKQTENFIARVLHLCQGEKGTKRVEDQQFKTDGLAV